MPFFTKYSAEILALMFTFGILCLSFGVATAWAKLLLNGFSKAVARVVNPEHVTEAEVTLMKELWKNHRIAIYLVVLGSLLILSSVGILILLIASK